MLCYIMLYYVMCEKEGGRENEREEKREREGGRVCMCVTEGEMERETINRGDRVRQSLACLLDNCSQETHF